MFITNCKIKYFIVILVINSTIIKITSAEKPSNFCDQNYVILLYVIKRFIG